MAFSGLKDLFKTLFSAAKYNFTFLNCFAESSTPQNWNFSACSLGLADKRTFSAELSQKPFLQHF